MRAASVPSAVVVLALLGASSSCLVWKNHWRNSNARQTADGIAYAAVADENDKHKLDIYAPLGAQGAPVVVFVHGGFWQRGDRDFYASLTGLYGNVGTALGDNDVVTVVPSYRLYPEVPNVDAMLDDLARALQWTHDHISVHGGDPNKIVLAGHSAGAHLALLLAQPEALRARGVDVDVVKGVVAVSGIYDVAHAAAHPTEPDKDVPWQALFGGRETRDSPRHSFGPAMPKTLFVVGGADYPNCKHDFDEAKATLAGLEGDRVFFKAIPALSHEDLVLNIGTAVDDVGPAVAAFAHFVTR
jgi:acetyl esterase/lipase